MDLQLTIDGEAVRGLMKASISSTNYYCADTFRLLVAAGAPPLRSIDDWVTLANGLIALSQTTDHQGAMFGLISGFADSIIVDPGVQTVLIEGRDLTARLIDSYTQQVFVNQTASEVVTSIAAQNGLICEATPTQGNVGRYFGDGYTRLSLGEFSKFRSNWDLIVELARQSSFDVYVSGSTLYYQPTVGVFTTALGLTPADVSAIRIQRNQPVRDVIGVKVQSWNSSQQSVYDSVSTDSGNTTDSAVDPVRPPNYLFSASNLTSAQVDVFSAMYMNEVGRLQTVLNFEMPMRRVLTPRTLVRLMNCSSTSDGLYHIDAVERHYTTTSGSTQAVRAVLWQPAN